VGFVVNEVSLGQVSVRAVSPVTVIEITGSSEGITVLQNVRNSVMSQKIWIFKLIL
jgi:hypothetical protein